MGEGAWLHAMLSAVQLAQYSTIYNNKAEKVKNHSAHPFYPFPCIGNNYVAGACLKIKLHTAQSTIITGTDASELGHS